MKNFIKVAILAIAFVWVMMMLVMAITAEKADASDGPFVGDAECGVMANQSIEAIDDYMKSDLCTVGDAGNTPPVKTATGWEWVCYDTGGHLYNPQGEIDVKCSANAILPKVETTTPEEVVEETVVEIVEVTAPPVVEEKEEVVEVVRSIPTPVYVAPVVEEKKKSKKSKKRNKHEWFEHECLIDRSEATWNYKKRSVNEIKTRCRVEVAVCPIRSQFVR